MSTDRCPDEIYISDQADIDNGNFTCNQTAPTAVVRITNATRQLDFHNFLSVDTIEVHESPGLELLSFPDLSTIFRKFEIVNATLLSNISLPSLTPGPSSARMDDSDVEVSLITFNITDTPSLTNISFGTLNTFNNLSLVNTGRYSGLFESIVAVGDLTLGDCFDLPELEFVHNLQIIGDGFCPYLLGQITSVNNLALINVERRYLSHSFRVNGSLIIEDSDYPTGLREGTFPEDVQSLSTIGSHATISTNSNAQLRFTELTTIGGDLSIYNNTNCTLGFDQLTSVAVLSLIDNMNTSLTWFPSLQRADSIHLRGYIDTSPGPNLFPALTAVPGTVIVEAWNSDFNCSRLVDQFHAGIIHNLICNGTDDATDISTTPSPIIPTNSTSSTLSRGAWAGIGVGIGVAVLVFLLGIVWLFRRSERWKREIMEKITP